MKTNFKYERIAEDIKEILTKTLNEEVDGCEYVSITDVIITKDMCDAKIYFQVLNDQDLDYIKEQIKDHTHVLKDSIANNLKIRKIPNLIFKYDDSLDNYNKIDQLLNNENNH